jgi:hypothetical protein
MSSQGKKKTTMAKLNREAKMRERKALKKIRKDTRRDAALNGEEGAVSEGQFPAFDADAPDPDPSGVGRGAHQKIGSQR